MLQEKHGQTRRLFLFSVFSVPLCGRSFPLFGRSVSKKPNRCITSRGGQGRREDEDDNAPSSNRQPINGQYCCARILPCSQSTDERLKASLPQTVGVSSGPTPVFRSPTAVPSFPVVSRCLSSFLGRSASNLHLTPAPRRLSRANQARSMQNGRSLMHHDVSTMHFVRPQKY